MLLHRSCRIAGLFALLSALPRLGLAQPEKCIITPKPPTFVSGETQDRLHALPHPRTAPHSGFHGQSLWGRNTLWFSHLAVFMGEKGSHPHNFQVILEVEFEDSDDKARYQSDRAEHPESIYTAGPPPFDQAALVTDYDGRRPLRRFPESAVFRGHFEQGGVRILQGTTFEVRRVVYFREFLLGGSKLSQQHYLLFGKGGDVFLSHLLSAPPDFDQMLAVQFEAREIPSDVVGKLIEDLLAGGLYLGLPDRGNTAAKRLRKGDSLTCSLETGRRALPIEVKLNIVDEPYCEAGEFVKLVTDEFNQPQPCEP